MTMARSHLRQGLLYLALIALTALTLLPIYWMVIASLQGSELPSTNLLPAVGTLTIDAYREVFANMPFARWFLNSVIVAAGTTAVALLFSIFAAYAMARFRFRGRTAFAMFVIGMQLLPGIATAIPLYVILANLGLLNTYPGLILAYVSRALPFCMWMLWGYFNSIPGELEEAARMDGASRMQALFLIIIPVALPGVIAVGLFSLVLSWEEYLYPLMIMATDDLLTLTVGAGRLSGNQSIAWGRLMAYSVMMTAPVGLLFIYVQKYLVQGLTAGAVKS